MVSETAQKNTKKTYIVLLVVTLVFILLTFFILNSFNLGYISIIIAIILPCLITITRYFSSTKTILSLNNARIATEEEYSYISDILENLCHIYDLPIPKLYLIEDEQPNAFSAGLNPQKAVLCLTTGIFDCLDEQEFECVLAHELAHIKSYDTLLSNIVTVTVGSSVIWSDKFARYLLKRTEKGKKKIGTLLNLYNLFLIITTPISAKLMEVLLPKDSKLLADKKSIEITNNPNSLITALEILENNEMPLNILNVSTSHLFIVNSIKPVNGKEALNMLQTHPNIEERIKSIENFK